MPTALEYADSLDAHMGEGGKYNNGNVQDLIKFIRDLTAEVERLRAENARLTREMAPLTPTGVQALEQAERERDEWKELREKDVWFQSALFQLLAENGITPSSGELLSAWKEWERSEQETRLQNDREWRAKIDHVKRQLTAARAVIDAADGCANVCYNIGQMQAKDIQDRYLQSAKRAADTFDEARKGQAGAETEIEITSEMIKAGRDEFLALESRDLLETDPSNLVCNIYIAMMKAAGRSPA